ncbi:MAG: AIR synthase related protein [Opitutales bacterium]
MSEEATGATGRYAARGVSSTKEAVHAVVDRLERGLFPGAFCKLTPDYLTGDPSKCCVIHADGSGTKSILAYLHWRETGDPSAFRGIAQDSIVMNLDDLLCVGVTQGIVLSSTINRNARRIPGEVLAALIEGTEDFLERLRAHGVGIESGGGETADVGDLTATCTVDSCAVAVLPRAQVLTNAGIEPGLAIVGFASDGQATYEDAPNSGIGSNGLTSARHDLLGKAYAEIYPETFDAQTDPSLVYSGPHRLGDPLPGSELTVGQALLSPTRTYAPLIAELLKTHRSAIRGLVHCSGGGQTKCLRFGRGVHFVKDNVFEPPPVFTEIQRVSGTAWSEMFLVFNMGHRMEAYCPPETVEDVLAVAQSFGLRAQVVGRTEPTLDPNGGSTMSLTWQGHTYTYRLPDTLGAAVTRDAEL